MLGLDNRYLLPVIALILFFAFIIWWVGANGPEKVSQEQVLEWIQDGYPSQFCTTIYPKLADCVSFTVTECEAIAEQQVQPCIDAIVQEMPQTMTKQESEKYYRSTSACFEKNMHQHLLDQYVIDSDECRQRMQ